MTEAELVDAVYQKEGDTYGDETTTPPIDQPTGRGGITLETLRAFQGHGTVDDLKALTRPQAYTIIQWVLRRLAQQARLALIAYEPLRVQMLDFAYNSGEGLAIRWLQRVLRVPRSSVLDLETEDALRTVNGWLVNEALVGARLQMLDRATDHGSIDKRYEEGLESRALTFSQLEVP